MNVAIIGATDKPDRFAFRAQQSLINHGHTTFPVSLSGKIVLGQQGYKNIGEISEETHTVTVYLNSNHFSELVNDVILSAPVRVIFNPGTEDAEIARKFEEAGIEVVEDCTLVMLEKGTFG